MSDDNIRELQELLQRLCFPGKVAWQLEAYKEANPPSFHLFCGRTSGEDTLLYALEFQKGERGNYRLDGYSLSLACIEVPKVTIRDIDTRVLEESLKQADRYHDFLLRENWEEGITKEEYHNITRYMEATNAALERLASFKEGEEIAKLLMLKYWPECRYRQHFGDYPVTENRYKITGHFPVAFENTLTANQSYQQLKTNFMNEKNFEYLKDNLKYLGFGEGLGEALKEQLQSGAPAFHLSFDMVINKKSFSAVLSFRKSENTDRYFFNSFHAALTRSNGEVKDQVFYLYKGKGVTAKEAFNLLEGRAVYKELENKDGEKYYAWLQLDFTKRDKNNNHEVKQYHENYGYNLKDALSMFPIRDMQEPDLRDILLSSLQKGNLQAVALEREGVAVRMFVESNPQYKSINVYDSELKRVPKEILQLYTGKAQDKEVMPSKKQENKSVVENPKSAKAKSTKHSVGH